MVFQQGISLGCNCQKFAECDRCVLNLLQPYLMQAEENHSAFSQIQQILRLFKEALDRECAIALKIDGRVKFMTQQAENLLSQYFNTATPHSLPEPLERWCQHQISRLACDGDVPFACLPLQVQQAERQLIIHLVPDRIRKQYILLLEEREPQTFSISALELLGITKREAEVLFWIAKDKSNAQIAKDLGCREGTVRKHLEHLYKKLGVQTRTAAVMVALEKLGLLNGEFVAISS
jgi:DNA-binding CsgD family transcriptional regulator